MQHQVDGPLHLDGLDEVVMEGRTLRFGKIPERGTPIELEYGVNTANGAAVRLHSFYPRATAAQPGSPSTGTPVAAMTWSSATSSVTS